MVEDLDSSAYEAVGDPAAAVDVGSLHDDAVLDLCVQDGGVVAYAGVGADVRVGAYKACSACDEYSLVCYMVSFGFGLLHVGGFLRLVVFHRSVINIRR